MIPNYHILTVKSVSETNNSAAKVKIYSSRFKQTVTIPYSNEAGSAAPTIETAVKYLQGKGFNIIGQSYDPNQYYLFTDSKGVEGFTPLKPIK